MPNFVRYFSIFFVVFLISKVSVFAQSYNITGQVKDNTQLELGSATIYIESVKDSTVIDYTITRDDGKFELKGKTNDEIINFFISYTGYEDYKKQIDLTEEPNLDLGVIELQPLDNVLGEIVIKGSAPPIKLKKDTLEFNVSSFKTKENANLEDLLKKLPGVTVDNDGSIKINGKDVTKIKVNGKDFFGDDPKIATKNLPKDLLEKIQVVDTKSKEDEFTGKESDSDDKTINVTIREEDNKGLFARITAGGGTDHRYSLNGIANYFKNDQRLSVLGSTNNVNSIGFSFDEIYDAMGRSAYAVVNGNNSGGITKSSSAGFDFVDSWGDKVDFTADYFYNRASTESGSKIQRENILPDRRYFNNSESSSKNVNNNHRGSFELEYEPDTLTRISVRPNITANNGYFNSTSFSESLSEGGDRFNDSETEQHSETNGLDFSNRLYVIRKFGQKDGFFQVSLNNRNGTQNQTRANLTSRNIYDELGAVTETSTQDQLIKEDRKNDEYSVTARTRIPLDDNWKLDGGYSYTNGRDDNERLLYEPNSGSDSYDVLNEELSSNFKSKSIQHRPYAGLTYRSEKLNASLNGGMESTQLKNQELFTDTSFDNTYNNLFARFFLRYRIDQMKSLSFFYTNSRSVPSVTQLQPVSNTTNPLNIITGNPDLKPTLTNRLSLNYYNFNYQTHQGMFIYLGGNYNTDQVVSRTLTDENLVRNTTYTNVDGSYDFRLRGNVFKEFKMRDKSTLKPQIGVGAGLRRDIGFSNEQRYKADNWNVGPRVSLEYDIPDVINISPSYELDYNQTKYSLNSRRNQNYTDHNLRMEITSYWPKNVIFGNDITYTHIGETAPGFDNNYVLWNMSLGYEIWDGDGTFKVTVFDLLNQNVSTSRRTGEDYIQDTQQLVLNRYAMLSFTYKISKFGGKKTSSSNQSGGRSGGRRWRG